MDDDALMAQVTTIYDHLMATPDEGFEMMQMAARDEILRSMDQDDTVGELRGRVLQGICDAVARQRP